MKFKNMLDLFSKKSEDLGAKGSFAIAQDDEGFVIQRTESEESHDKEVLRFAQDDEKISLAPMREREELLSERSELSNSGEGCKELPSPVAFATQSPKCRKTRNFDKMLKQVQHDNFSCAEHTETDLPPNRPIVLTTFKKAAFTLAEVLITLGIIGVVAAMTLPTLIQNHQKQAYVTGLKKAISITSNMFLKMQADEGVDFAKTSIVTDGLCNFFISDNGCEDAYGNPSVLETIIPKYLNVVKICKNDAECTTKYTDTSLSCTNNKCTIRDLDGKYGISHFTKNSTKASFRGFYTNDGMIYYIELGDAGLDLSLNAFNIYVDINGDKGPNKEGRDLFSYSVLANGKIYINYNSYVDKIIENGWKMDY